MRQMSASRRKKDGKTFGGEEISRSYADLSSRVFFSSNPLMHLRIPSAGRAAGNAKELRFGLRHQLTKVARHHVGPGINVSVMQAMVSMFY